MSKYIDAEKLKAEIIRLRKEKPFHDDASFLAYLHGLSKIEELIDSLQQEQPAEKTCKDCGFYDNNCPYIRGKFIPYPSKVCEDYIYSVIKAQEQPTEDLKGEIREWVNLMVGASFPEQDGDYISEEDYRSVIRQTARHFYELGKKCK